MINIPDNDKKPPIVAIFLPPEGDIVANVAQKIDYFQRFV